MKNKRGPKPHSPPDTDDPAGGANADAPVAGVDATRSVGGVDATRSVGGVDATRSVDGGSDRSAPPFSPHANAPDRNPSLPPRHVLRLEGFLGGLLVVLGILLVVWTRNYVVQVLAVGGTLWGLLLLSSWARPGLDRIVNVGRLHFNLKEALAELWGPLILAGLLVVIYWPLVRGLMPQMADHTVHQYKAYVLAEHLIPSGRLVGWSHLLGAGRPAGQLYPILGELWVVAVRYLTLGQLSWETTYAWALFGVLSFSVFVPYYVARRLYGSVAGFVAGFLVLIDMGGFREGGWIFTVRYGVWPLALAVSLGLLTLERLTHLAAKKTLAGLLSFAVVAALGLTAHPINLLLLIIAVPTYCLYAHLWCNRGHIWLKAFGGLVLAVGLCAFWFLPYLARAGDYSAHVSNLWKSLPAMSADFLEGSLFEGYWIWALFLGAFGALLATFERRPHGRFLAALSALLLIAASITVYAATGVENWLGSVRHVQFQRFVIFVKLLWAITAGYLVQRIFAGTAARADGGKTKPLIRIPRLAPRYPARGRRRAAQALGLLLCAPFVVPLMSALASHHLAPLSRIQTRRDNPAFHRDVRALLQRIRKRELQNHPFFRVAYWTPFNDHSLANAPIFADLPAVKCSFIPAETFKYLANSGPNDVPRTAADFRVLNVKYILANRPLPPTLRNTRLIEKRGALSLYEFLGYVPERATLRGPGRVATLTHKPETLRFRVSDVPGQTELVAYTAHFANWQAYQNGKQLNIEPYDALAPHVDGLMRVKVKNGVVTFRYVQQPLDWATKLVSLLTLLVALFIYLAQKGVSHFGEAWQRMQDTFARYARIARGAAFGLTILFFGAMVTLWWRADALPPRGRSLTWELDRAQVFVEHKTQVEACRLFVDGRFICGTKGYQYVGPVSEEWNLKNRRGLWAHPHPGGTLVIEYPNTRLGKTLAVEYGILKSGSGGRGTVTLTVVINGETLAALKHKRVGWAGPRRLDTSRWAQKHADVRFEIRADDISARHFVFDARILP